MKRTNTLATCLLLLAATSNSGFGTTVSFGGETYETVSWSSTDLGTNQAAGSANFTSVDFSTGSFAGGNPVISVGSSATYAADSAFDALTYGAGDIESLDIFAISSGSTTISLSGQADSILLFIATADGFTAGLDAGQWEFAAEWNLSIIDSVSLQVAPGNILQATGGGGGQGGTGVVRISRVDEASFNVVSFSNPGGGGANGDGMSLGIAINQIPEPSSGLLCLFGIGTLIAFRRR